MNVVFVIAGCEAIPVRAIPFVTGWTMSPDMVASALAHTDLVTKLRGIAAYHLAGNDEPAPMLPKEWDGVEAELQALSDTLKANEVVDFESYPTWRRESILLLPAGVFVWKDEFICAFASAYSKERIGILDERPGDRELNLTPLIPQALCEALVEGFASVEKPTVQVLDHHQSDAFKPLTASLAGYWDTPFNQLPDAVKPFALELEPMGWDGISPQQRQSVATQLDWQHDPRCEPSLYWELTAYQAELEQQESVARSQANHGVALALVDVQKRIDVILGTDRARVGGEIQGLRELKVAHQYLMEKHALLEKSTRILETDRARADAEIFSLRENQKAANAEAAQQGLATGNVAKGQKSLSTAEVNSLLKLVVGMAIGGYRYDPESAKSSVPGEIAGDLANIEGLSLDDDTVRKYLNMAKKSVLSGKLRQP
jgi:hypothetical protein